MKTLIKVDHLHLGYDNQEVINDLSFDINQGDFITVLGQNGAGKSTLIKGLLGLIKPMDGQITYYLNEREIGYMPQETKVDRHFPASVYEIVLSGALNRVGYRPFFNSKEKKLAVECLKTLHIENLKNNSFGELSGGQRQKVLLARALCATSKVILLDEPVTGLDPKVTAEFYELLKELNDKGITVIMVSHDLQSVSYATHILYLDSKDSFYGTKKEFMQSDKANVFGQMEGDEE